jgi:hypothetical protein
MFFSHAEYRNKKGHKHKRRTNYLGVREIMKGGEGKQVMGV